MNRNGLLPLLFQGYIMIIRAAQWSLASKNHKLLGFGGMISGRLLAVRSVARALDLEGEKVAEEETGNVGARHRSAYRLAGALPGAVAIVVSQDGGVRFICKKGGLVTYWEQE
jgi:hypothetical protein